MSELDTPGLKKRKRADGSFAYYWVAAAVTRHANGYPLKTRRLHYTTEADVAARCQLLTAELREWLSHEGNVPLVFNGTIGSLIEFYQRDEDSPYHGVKTTTRVSYDGDLKILKRVIGDRRVDALTRKDFRRWHQTFIAPKEADGPPRIRRAHGLMTMLRMLFKFGSSMRFDGCRAGKEVLEEMTFETPARREQAITFAQAAAVIDVAAQKSYRSIALGQALQFELGLRQIDVVGQWVKAAGVGGIIFRGQVWTGGITWSDLTAEKLAKRTSKTGQEGQWDRTLSPLLMKAIALFREDERVGPAVIDEHTKQPFKPKGYSRRWRWLADQAGVPRSVWNMDSRAGAITEADEAGAQPGDITEFATHANAQTTRRYMRRTLEATMRVAKLRVAHREKTKPSEQK